MHDTQHTHRTHHSDHTKHASRPGFDWDAVYRGDASDTTAPDPLLLAPADSLTPGKALDLGCGAGGNALALAERGWRVTGVDISPRAIAGTRAGACARGLELELLVADTALWQPETTYGFVLSAYALPPRGPARTATLAVAAAALAPGGILALGEWDEEGCDWGGSGDLVTLDELRADLSGLGLDILRAERLRVPVHQHPGHEQEPADDAAVIVTARKPQAA
ncbi:class I SAM-dependent methyltransferase [Streptomyces sp. NPDC090021]|uniref:class I SAM-dependent methyltransferase n=1 Tax=Streptomyces sp. NPDC090021 TaxID=3365919 RepID=UPI0038064975